MNPGMLSLRPPENLAVLYAPSAVQRWLRLLLAFDNRLADLVLNGREPLIVQLKLAWWNDMLSQPASSRPKGEPMIELLRDSENGVCELPVAGLLNAWEILAAQEEWTDKTLAEFAQARSRFLFEEYAKWVGSTSNVNQCGARWALDDLGTRAGKSFALQSPDRVKLPRERVLRPLTILALLVQEVSGPRLLWHALTGR